MAKLVYCTLASLDGYITDEDGRFDWAMPDEDVFAYVNDFERRIGTYLYGRRLYEVMTGWDASSMLVDARPVERDFAALWQAAEKVVYSRTLATASTGRTRIERSFDPAAIRAWKAASPHDISVGGAELAGHAIRAGLVDEVTLILAPVIVGGGTHALPRGVRMKLELVDERRFAGGMVALRYRVAN